MQIEPTTINFTNKHSIFSQTGQIIERLSCKNLAVLGIVCLNHIHTHLEWTNTTRSKQIMHSQYTIRIRYIVI